MGSKSLSSRKQNLFFQHLVALSFDVATMSKEHKIEFHKKMFQLPNRKAMEVVTHFLLSKLNEVSRGRFSIIWPLIDFKDQRQFQKTSFDYLTRIAQESEIRFPLVLNSIFSSFGGEAFIDLYFAFSTHVVHQVNKTFGPMLRRPNLNPKFLKLATEVLKVTSIACVDKFQALTDATKFHLDCYFDIAKKLTVCVEHLKLSNSKSQSLLEEKIKTAMKILTQKSNLVENSLEGLMLNNKEYQDEVEKLWRKLESFLSTEEKHWDCISSELDDSTKPILKGSADSISLPNNLKICYANRYQNQLEVEKRLCIPSFLKLFSLSLEFYLDSIQKGKFSQTYKFQSSKDTSELDRSLKLLQSFCILLEEGNQVKRKLVDDLKENLVDFAKEKSDIFENLPPSPEKCLKRSSDFQNTSESIFFYPSLQDSKLNKSIEEASEVNVSLEKFDHAPVEDHSLFSSPPGIRKLDSITSFNNMYCDDNLYQSANKINFCQTSSKSSATKDSVSDFPEFDTSLSMVCDESLNLSDKISLSFLD